jgi:hypothetical protein
MRSRIAKIAFAVVLVVLVASMAAYSMNSAATPLSSHQAAACKCDCGCATSGHCSCAKKDAGCPCKCGCDKSGVCTCSKKGNDTIGCCGIRQNAENADCCPLSK